jgi:hypothetical protein
VSARLLVLLTLLAAPALAAPTVELCSTNLLPYVSQRTRNLGGRYVPRIGCAYSLVPMVAFQKIDGGYLIVPAAYAEETAPAPLILITKAVYTQGASVMGYAVYVRPGEYTSITGFSVSAFILKEVPPTAVDFEASKNSAAARRAKDLADMAAMDAERHARDARLFADQMETARRTLDASR